MKILPGWEKAIESSKHKQHKAQALMINSIPVSQSRFSGSLNVIDNEYTMGKVIQFLQEQPLSHIGIALDCEYKEQNYIGENVYPDIRSIKPRWIFLAPVVNLTKIYQFALPLADVRKGTNHRQLFAMDTPFVGHNMKELFFSLWQIGLEAPHTIWDTYICERFFTLGKFHKGYIQGIEKNDEARQISKETELKEHWENECSIAGACLNYGLPYGTVSESCSEHITITTKKNAIGSAMIYPSQVTKACQMAVINHLISEEMPWVKTNAKMEWDGIKVDYTRASTVKTALDERLKKIGEVFPTFGVQNPSSHKELTEFFRGKDLLHYFKEKSTGKYSFDRGALKRLCNIHPIVPLLQTYFKVKDLSSFGIFSPGIVGQDDRVHPQHIQLGTHTGRQTSQGLNILGTNKLLRNLIAPEEGYGICEVDWCQVEVGIAGAVYHEPRLVEMYNTGDAYSAMAQKFYSSDLHRSDLEMSSKDFKTHHPEKRKRMKTCTLALLYGVTEHGIVDMLGIDRQNAHKLLNGFKNMFPDLTDNMTKMSDRSAHRGYATALNGVARHRAITGKASKWELNWLRNHPVQGSCAVVFKNAGNQVACMIKAMGAKIIIPLHDSFIIEAPIHNIQDVVESTGKIMIHTLAAAYPMLKPRVDINCSHPGAWNKDGNINALEDWLEENDAHTMELLGAQA